MTVYFADTSFVSAYNKLLTIATAEGFMVDSPNNHPWITIITNLIPNLLQDCVYHGACHRCAKRQL